MKKRWSQLAAVAVAVAALFVFFATPPAGAPVAAIHAGALVVLAIGFWAFGVLPEATTGVLFLLLAIAAGVLPPQVMLAVAGSSALWLLLGGLIIADAVTYTRLGERIAALLLYRHAASYLATLSAVAIVASLLAFLMPATIGRILLLVPILSAVSAYMGFARGSAGYNGIQLCGITTTFHSGTAILPANAPNLVLSGAAETIYHQHLVYGEYLLVQFPVLGLLKAVVCVSAAWWMFPAQPRVSAKHASPAPMTAGERRLALILAGALAFWITDFLHGIQSGWIALAAGVVCALPRVGVLPRDALIHRINYGPFIYLGSIIALGGVIMSSGLSVLIGSYVLGALHLEAGDHAWNFAILSAASTMTGLLTTNPAQPALLAPLAGDFAAAAGWPIKTALMMIAIGFSTIVLPHMVPPVVVGLQVAGIGLRATLRFVWPVAAVSFALLLPLDYFWWRALGYFG